MKWTPPPSVRVRTSWYIHIYATKSRNTEWRLPHIRRKWLTRLLCTRDGRSKKGQKQSANYRKHRQRASIEFIEFYDDERANVKGTARSLTPCKNISPGNPGTYDICTRCCFRLFLAGAAAGGTKQPSPFTTKHTGEEDVSPARVVLCF